MTSPKSNVSQKPHGLGAVGGGGGEASGERYGLAIVDPRLALRSCPGKRERSQWAIRYRTVASVADQVT